MVSTRAQVVQYECNTFPQQVGWKRVGSGQVLRDVVGGYFTQTISNDGILDAYQQSLSDFADVSSFFAEWCVVTDAPSAILEADGTPVVVSAGGTGAHYHFSITDTRVRVNRGNFFPIFDFDVDPSMSHVYRLEIYPGAQDTPGQYLLFADGRPVDSGEAEYNYPDSTSVIVWGSRGYLNGRAMQTTSWDYIRFGVIPVDASGDYNNDGLASSDDFYFVHECLTNDRPGIKGGPGNDAGPGCRFTDFDGDADVDLRDVAAFQRAFANPS